LRNVVRRRRMALEMTVEQLAEAASVSPTFIYMVETNRRVPSLLIAKAIADALRGTIDDIFFASELTPCKTGRKGRKK
jgi:DNA-binding XRE family transcriptional regulator